VSKGPEEAIITGISRESCSNVSELPRVDRVALRADLSELRQNLGQAALTSLVRAAIDRARDDLLKDPAKPAPSADVVADMVRSLATEAFAPRARRVINATGVLLHTNLGRAPLSQRASAAVSATMEGYCSIELDLATGKRGKRGAFMEAALSQLTGSESAVVVNNCAAAVLLLLATVARGRPVIVSRGELVEIGGGFRVPDVMAESGAKLVEVGTTNKTRVADYERALDAHPDTAAILRVHPGNFRQIGFVERPALADLAALAKARNVSLLKDLGGGALVELADAGFPGEPMVESAIRAGVNAVTFSTDKVLGGPQGGAIVGDEAIVGRVRKHPLIRAFRLGRLPMVALEATLESYLAGSAWSDVPTLAMARVDLASLRTRAEALVRALSARGVTVRVAETQAEMGGGSLAGRSIPSIGVVVSVADHDSAGAFVAHLREHRLPVIGRVDPSGVVLDLRTVAPRDDEGLGDAVTLSWQRV